MQVLQVSKVLRMFASNDQVIESLRRCRGGHTVKNSRRTNRLVSNCSIVGKTWIPEVAKAWSDARDLVAHAVASPYSHEGYGVLKFPHAPDEY